MTPQTAWLIAISAVVLVGVVAFFIGRSTAGSKRRIDELEAELSSEKARVEGYRKEVEQHFDKTATLFVSMAGSYKEMFEHLSSGYEKLSTGSARDLFQQRVDALLIGSERNARATDTTSKLLGGAAAAGVASAAAAETVAPATAGPATAEAGTDAAPAETAAPVQATEPVAERRDAPESSFEPTPETGSQGATPALQGDAEPAAAVSGRELAPEARAEPAAADESDERMRKAEGIAFDPVIDEAPVRSEEPRTDQR